MEKRKLKTSKRNKAKWLVPIMVILVLAILCASVFYFMRKDESPALVPFEKVLGINSQIGISYDVVGTVARQVPECKNEGLARYPRYGQALSKADDESDEGFSALKQAILSENAYLNADPDATLSGTCTNYDALDQNGYLYLNGEAVMSGGVHRKLYKHTASVGMYFGDVSDDEVAVVKRIKIRPRQMGNYITGLYAPAGEVVKVTVSAEDLDAIKGFNIYIGATLANGQANNIWSARDFVRMPVVANKMPVNAGVAVFDAGAGVYTCYVGSYLGGAIYIGSPTVKAEFGVEISGAVEYPHFVYGLTTESEYNRLLRSTAPYFDMEIFDCAVRFSGPRTYTDKYSYAELCESAELWDKISRVSRQVPSGSNSGYGIDFLFEPFIAAGGAVAFVGRNTVNCPVDWVDGCLDVESFETNGSWGNIHEFNHHYQNFGLPNGGEVTNNAVSLVEYSLFTKISAKRSLDDSALGGWNAYTDPSRVLRMLLDNSAGGTAVESLDAYATVLHSFGQSVFIGATKNGSGADKWYKNLCDLTHHNMQYYFADLLHASVSDSVVVEVASKNYPMYVPVASIYQTGTKYAYDGEKVQIKTAQPFEFSGAQYDFGVKSMVHLPDGFTIDEVTVGQPWYGTLAVLGDDSYRFTPSANGESGDIEVTLSISKDDGAFEVEDVTLIFGFKQQQKRIAERTTYYFDEDILDVFESVDDAVAKRYAGYSSSAKFDSRFKGAECSAVWWDSEGVAKNAITEYNAKMYINTNNTYRFSIRGKYANLYVSLDGKEYELVARAGEVYNNDFAVSVQNGEYKDYTLRRGQVVYVKAVVMHVDVSRCAFVAGLGVSNNGEFRLDDMTKSATMYNVDYEKEAFESEYFYVREYAVTKFAMDTNATSRVVETNFTPWDDATKLDNLFDGDTSTYMHNERNKYVNETSPIEMVVDLGKKIRTNKIIMYGRAYNTQTPMSFRLYGGLTEDDMSLLCEYENKPLENGCNQSGDFELTQMRYYKLIITKTNANYVCLSNIEFCAGFADGKMMSPDDKDVEYFGGWDVDYDLSTFGHSYTTTNGVAKFEFVGSQLAILTKPNTRAKFTISIDGGEGILCESDGASELLYLSDVLIDKKHKIVITAVDKIDIVAFATR